MFKNIDEFREFNSKLILRCILVIYGVLTVAYIIEFIKHNRSLEYTIVFCTVLWSSYILDRITLLSNRFLKFTPYVATWGYLVFYAFCMFTTVSSHTWIYVFPFAVLVPLMFRNTGLIIFAYIMFLAINIADLIRNFEAYTQTGTSIVELEQRFACIVLVLAFLLVLSSLLKRYEDLVTFIYKEASIDQISGLKTSDYVKEKVMPMIDHNTNITYSMVLINIDRFYKFNNIYGHAYGDKVLNKIGEIISKELNSIKANVTACRLHGDKFLLIFTNRTFDEVSEYYNAIKSRLNALIIKKGSKELMVETTISVTDTRLCEHTYEGMYNRLRFLQDVARTQGKNMLIEDSINLNN